MSNSAQHTIYTIGHSTHTMSDFIAMLQSFGIKNLVDIRSMPGSRKFPQFDKDNLETALPENGIKYIYMKDLGGRRKVQKDSKNNRWKNVSFRAYADYMETADFKNAVTELENIALQAPTAFMCAEAVWWRCHRSMVSDYLKAKSWKVLHIMNIGKVQEHTYTSPAKIIDDRVSYAD
jgi:uncharacterized protein (DUF488 family)